ncbi:hypothetical protein Pst134EA_011726 [Puccinia striiformis f. sp. tritici]|uniref:hypothetical protein n=1 Tax=Puccinia striiformis f. sp. tritici TaxID=168172 RepID=UPI0020080138|nr:hypothetical protein Pst134EA_011726 [Puccinia striiformis f. sp. tritici]KAH9468105.1 hypothetical protein Pst134EA_011726 [Puccinia striiformis f. sp. tritici]KAI9605305.1 hypothetical protein H4Q26_003288 [Puccinia striiformis f. sp. tritici PST-130]
MLQFLRLMAFVSLIALREVTSDQQEITYFGCHRDVDALCSHPAPNGQHTLKWAIRVKKGTRNYKCVDHYTPQCCNQHKFQRIDWSPHGSITIPTQDLTYCKKDGE